MPSALLDRLKSQMNVLSPVLDAIRQELGEARATALLHRALAEWRVRQAVELHEGIAGSPVERFLAGQRTLAPQIGDAVEFEMLEQTPQRAAFDIKRCAIAEYFRSLGESDLGYELVCRLDDTIAEQIGEGQVQLARSGTLMCGAERCDFRYTLGR
jgi:hypothetical protein